MRFNLEHYRRYRRAAGKPAKNGVWDITVFPNGKYCFATGQWLGPNGEIPDHPLLGKSFQRVEDGKLYTVDGVNIHWQEGFYYYATLVDSKNSHTTAFIGNINCTSLQVLEWLANFKKEWKQISL